jgi:hypothetical protein
MNPNVIQDILSELLDQKIVLETDGCYEVTHDILAARVNERRITEDNNRIEATRLVYETEKNHGNLNEKQINIIEPYLHNLAFAIEDKERLTKYIEKCKQIIKDEQASKEAMLKKEQQLRITAEQNKNEAIKAKKKAFKRRNLARVWAILGVVCALVALFAKMDERRSKLRLLFQGAELQLNNLDFYSANQTTQDIQDIIENWFLKKYFDFKKDSFVLWNNAYKNKLFFHLTGEQIIPATDYILCNTNKRIIIKKSDNSTPKDLNSVFLDSTFENLSNYGLSETTNNFWISELIDTINNKNTITLYTILPYKKYHYKIIDTVGVASADIDAAGNLYYFKEGKIFCYNKESNIHMMLPLNFNIPNLKKRNTTLTFIKNLNQEPSDYLSLKIHDSLFIVNKNTYKTKTIPHTMFLTIDSNKYLIYCQKASGRWPLYICNLEKETKENIKPVDHFTPLQVNKFDQSIATYLKDRIKISVRFSPDNKKSIDYDPDNNTLLVNTKTKKTKSISLDPTKQLYAYEALDSLYVYVYKDEKNKEVVSFNDYYSNKMKAFIVPDGWTFKQFKNNKYILFTFNLEGRESIQAILLIAPYMFKENFLEKWFNKY